MRSPPLRFASVFGNKKSLLDEWQTRADLVYTCLKWTIHLKRTTLKCYKTFNIRKHINSFQKGICLLLMVIVWTYNLDCARKKLYIYLNIICIYVKTNFNIQWLQEMCRVS